MNKWKDITIITPTFNRSSNLNFCYESLVKQTCKNFNWIIVDDGSTDDTKEVVDKFCEENLIDIKYFYKKNGGKHTALNLAVDKTNSELVMVLDSDDILTSDAVKTILEYHRKYKNNNSNICGYSFLRVDMNGQIIGKFGKELEEIDDFINMRINKKITGDKCEVFYTKILKEYPFPIFENEKFLGENVIWMKLALKYRMVFINIPIYKCEYLDGGLTKSGRKLRINCPKGGMEYAKINMIRECNLLHRIKYGILFNTYSYFANVKFLKLILQKEFVFLITFTRPAGFIVYQLWKNKYKN